jgi:transcriptional regulator with XRE-family HTH domain
VGRFRRNAVNEIDIAVGKVARFFRIQAGMSQATRDGELGVTFQQIQKYETGVSWHWLRPPAQDRQAVQADHGSSIPKSTTDGAVNIDEIIALTDRPQTMRTPYSNSESACASPHGKSCRGVRDDADARRVAGDAKKENR